MHIFIVKVIEKYQHVYVVCVYIFYDAVFHIHSLWGGVAQWVGRLTRNVEVV